MGVIKGCLECEFTVTAEESFILEKEKVAVKKHYWWDISRWSM